jgi:hypothetical protein
MHIEESLSVSGAFVGERLQRHVAIARTLLITGFEWFGELQVLVYPGMNTSQNNNPSSVKQ